MSTRLFIGGIPYEARDDDLRELFARAGEVVSVQIKTDRNTGKSRGFGFVEMIDDDAANRALDELNGVEMFGRKLRVQWAESREDEAQARQSGRTERPPRNDDSGPQSPPPPSPPPRNRSWLLVAGALVVALIASGVWLGRTVEPEAHTLLVSPFEVRGQTDGAEYLGLSLAEAVVVNLAPLEGLKLPPVPRGLSGNPKEEFDAAGKAQAGYLLRGTLTRAGDRVLVKCDLVAVATEKVVWTTERSANGSEIPLIGSAIAYEVAKHLALTFPKLYEYVTDIGRDSEIAETADAKLTVDALRMGQFQDALLPATRLLESFPKELAPAVWRSHALLLAWDAEPTPKAREELRSSLAYLRRVDAKSPYIEFYEAYIENQTNPDKAVELFSTILARQDLTPGARSWILRFRGLARRGNGDVKGSMNDLNASLALDPTNAFTLLILSGLHEQSGELEEALLRARQALAVVPEFWRGYHTLGVALSAAKRWGEAADAFGKACDAVSTQGPCSLYAVTLQKAGKGPKAELAATLAEKLPPSAPGQYNLGCFWALAGQPDKAVTMLSRAIAAGFSEPIISKDPDLASLRGREDFQALVEKLETDD